MNPSPSIASFGPASCGRRGWAGFTLIEILAASAISAMILLAVYGIFQRAMKMRDHAMERTRDAAIRARAVNVIRNDLQNGYYSGTNGKFTVIPTGDKQSQMSRFPGYLRFTTTTGKDSATDAYGDVQQVEYYIADQSAPGGSANADSAGLESQGSGRNRGTLVRALTRDLLSTSQSPTLENVLTGVESFEVSFFDASTNTWQPSWPVSSVSASATPPQLQAIRVSIQQGKDTFVNPPPLEILVPWATHPWL